MSVASWPILPLARITRSTVEASSACDESPSSSSNEPRVSASTGERQRLSRRPDFGVVTTPFAGWLTGRVGARRVVTASLLPLGPLFLLFTLGGGGFAIVCLLGVGACHSMLTGVTVAAAQECLPGREGLAVGVAMGVGALGSLLLPLLGLAADGLGLIAALRLSATIPMLAALLALGWTASVRGRPAQTLRDDFGERDGRRGYL